MVQHAVQGRRTQGWFGCEIHQQICPAPWTWLCKDVPFECHCARALPNECIHRDSNILLQVLPLACDTFPSTGQMSSMATKPPHSSLPSQN